MKFKRSDNINTAIIKGISVAIVFFAVVILVLCAVFAFFYEGEFVSALSQSLSPWFYVTTLAVLLISSIIYTPFSYGISMYFLKSKTQTARFSDIFYLFNNGRLLLKAILTDTFRRCFATLFRILTLFLAVVIELAVLFVLDGAKDSMLFVTVTVLLWCAVIAVFLYIKLKFILCKYVLISSPNSSALDCIRKGTRAINGRVYVTLRFYIKYLAIYIFTFFTLGLAGAKRVNRFRDSFCTYAVRLVSNY